MDFCIIPETFEAAGEVKAVNPPNKETRKQVESTGARAVGVKIKIFDSNICITCMHNYCGSGEMPTWIHKMFSHIIHAWYT